jgi:hypothetical protein
MCNPNQLRQCAAFRWSNQVAQVVRTAFFCERLHRGPAPHVSGASTPAAMGDYPGILPCLFGSSDGSRNFMTKLATSQVRLKLRSGGRVVAANIFSVKCFLNAAHVLGALADPLVKPEGVTNPEGY